MHCLVYLKNKCMQRSASGGRYSRFFSAEKGPNIIIFEHIIILIYIILHTFLQQGLHYYYSKSKDIFQLFLKNFHRYHRPKELPSCNGGLVLYYYSKKQRYFPIFSQNFSLMPSTKRIAFMQRRNFSVLLFEKAKIFSKIFLKLFIDAIDQKNCLHATEDFYC